MSKHYQLNASLRDLLGTKSMKVVRRKGDSPAVIYSKSLKSISLSINTGEFLKVYKQSGYTHVIDLSIDGKVQPCLVKDLDVHPSKRTLRHVDFIAVNLKEKITAFVPIKLTGVSEGAKNLGGVVNPALEEIEIEALPDNLPEEIVVNIESLKTFGDAIYIRDIKVNSKYVILAQADELVVNLAEQSQEIIAEEVVTEVTTGEDKSITK